MFYDATDVKFNFIKNQSCAAQRGFVLLRVLLYRKMTVSFFNVLTCSPFPFQAQKAEGAGEAK